MLVAGDDGCIGHIGIADGWCVVWKSNRRGTSRRRGWTLRWGPSRLTSPNSFVSGLSHSPVKQFKRGILIVLNEARPNLYV